MSGDFVSNHTSFSFSLHKRTRIVTFILHSCITRIYNKKKTKTFHKIVYVEIGRIKVDTRSFFVKYKPLEPFTVLLIHRSKNEKTL